MENTGIYATEHTHIILYSKYQPIKKNYSMILHIPMELPIQILRPIQFNSKIIISLIYNQFFLIANPKNSQSKSMQFLNF